MYQKLCDGLGITIQDFFIQTCFLIWNKRSNDSLDGASVQGVFIVWLGIGCISPPPGGGYARSDYCGRLSAYTCLKDGTERFS